MLEGERHRLLVKASTVSEDVWYRSSKLGVLRMENQVVLVNIFI